MIAECRTTPPTCRVRAVASISPLTPPRLFHGRETNMRRHMPGDQRRYIRPTSAVYQTASRLLFFATTARAPNIVFAAAMMFSNASDIVAGVCRKNAELPAHGLLTALPREPGSASDERQSAWHLLSLRYSQIAYSTPRHRRSSPPFAASDPPTRPSVRNAAPPAKKPQFRRTRTVGEKGM